MYINNKVPLIFHSFLLFICLIRWVNGIKIWIIPVENVCDTIIWSDIKASEKSGYEASNTTEKLVEVASKADNVVDRATELGFGSESVGALGKVVFKATEDLARNNNVCTGLGLVSRTCKTVVMCCFTIKVITNRIILNKTNFR